MENNERGLPDTSIDELERAQSCASECEGRVERAETGRSVAEHCYMEEVVMTQVVGQGRFE